MQQSKHICQHEHMLRTLRPGALNQQYPDSALGGMLGQLLQEALVIVKTSEDIMGIVLRHLLLEKIRIKLAAQHTEPIGDGATPVGIMKIHLTICSMLKRCSAVAVNILIAVQRGQPHQHGRMRLRKAGQDLPCRKAGTGTAYSPTRVPIRSSIRSVYRCSW